MRRIGIDVGGTNTDAVLLTGDRVAHAVKTPTTADVTTGIERALARLVEESRGDRRRVDAVMIGTTHFTNAVVQRRDLTPVAAIRIGLPASASLEPFIDWPPDLAARSEEHTSELQSRLHLVCRLLLEKKKNKTNYALSKKKKKYKKYTN